MISLAAIVSPPPESEEIDSPVGTPVSDSLLALTIPEPLSTGVISFIASAALI